MSLILDALNRSRSEAEPVPGLGTDHGPAAAPGSPLRRYLPWVALGLALLCIAWLLVDRGGDEAPASVPRENVSPSVGAPAGQGAPRPETTAPAAGAPATGSAANNKQAAKKKGGRPVFAAGPSSPDAYERTAGRVAAAQKKAQEKAAGEKDQAQQSESDAAVAALYEQQPEQLETEPEPAPVAPPSASTAPVAEADEVPAVEEEPVDVEQMLLQAREAMQNEGLVDHPVPFITNLSQQTKDQIPSVLYQRHDYSERGATVVLNGKSVREGGSAGSGISVREILPNSVILEHKGVKFRLRALNSWVNL